jgi:hypothetical protein
MSEISAIKAQLTDYSIENKVPNFASFIDQNTGSESKLARGLDSLIEALHSKKTSLTETLANLQQ